MTIELVPLATVRMQLQPSIILEGVPRGTRRIVELTGITIEGERLVANQKGSAAADWLLLGPDGTQMLDVRYCVQTHDGALVYVSYTGRTDATLGPGTAPIYAAPQFETGDARYAWLNKVQAVAKGTIDPTRALTYEMYELR